MKRMPCPDQVRGGSSAAGKCLPAHRGAGAGGSSGSSSSHGSRDEQRKPAVLKRALLPSTPAIPPTSSSVTQTTTRGEQCGTGSAGLQESASGVDDDGDDGSTASSSAISGNSSMGSVAQRTAQTAAAAAEATAETDLQVEETNAAAGVGNERKSLPRRLSAKLCAADTDSEAACGSTRSTTTASQQKQQSTSTAALAAAEASEYEATHVHSVYSSIASHFSSTRHKPWPRVSLFLQSLPPTSIGFDVGCGNGKYIGVNRDVWMIGSDACRELLVCAQNRLLLGGGQTTGAAGAAASSTARHSPLTLPLDKGVYGTPVVTGTAPVAMNGREGGKSKRTGVQYGSLKQGGNNTARQNNDTALENDMKEKRVTGEGKTAVAAAASRNTGTDTNIAIQNREINNSSTGTKRNNLNSVLNPTNTTRPHPWSGGEATIAADGLALPFRSRSADFAICIAVLHHLSTRERRVEGVAAVLECLRPQGQALLYVWALEQEGSRRGWREGGEQDLLVPWVVKGGGGGTGSRKGRKKRKGKGGDGSGQDAGDKEEEEKEEKTEEKKVDEKEDATYKRYYHLYTKGELEEDVITAGGVVVESGYEKDNWWVVCERRG